MPRYSEDELLDALRRVAEQLGRTPKVEDLRGKKGLPHSATYRLRFGSWKKALSRAGLHGEGNESVGYNDDELLTHLKRAATILGRAPKADELHTVEGFPNALTYQNRFGSWNNALGQAGLGRRGRKPRYTDDGLLDILRRVANDLGRTPTTTELGERDDSPSPATFINRFGSWKEALGRAALQPGKRGRRRYTDDDLLKLLKEAAERLGRAPKSSEAAGIKGLPSPLTYQKRFGSWKESLHKAGLTSTRKARYSDDELLAALHRVAERLGRTPRIEDMVGMKEFPHPATYRLRFGSWRSALKKAGLQRSRKDLPTDDEFIKGLVRLAKDLGRTPGVEDVRGAKDLPRYEDYIERFGTWQNALFAACLIEEKQGMTLLTPEQQRVIAALDEGAKELDTICRDVVLEKADAKKAIKALLKRGILEKVHPIKGSRILRYTTVDERLNEVLDREAKVFKKSPTEDDDDSSAPKNHLERLLDKCRD